MAKLIEDELRARFADLSRNEKQYLSRRICSWCENPLDRPSCGAIYEKCSVENRMTRLEKCLADYKPRRALENTNAR